MKDRAPSAESECGHGLSPPQHGRRDALPSDRETLSPFLEGQSAGFVTSHLPMSPPTSRRVSLRLRTTGLALALLSLSLAAASPSTQQYPGDAGEVEDQKISLQGLLCSELSCAGAGRVPWVPTPSSVAAGRGSGKGCETPKPAHSAISNWESDPLQFYIQKRFKPLIASTQCNLHARACFKPARVSHGWGLGNGHTRGLSQRVS